MAAGSGTAVTMAGMLARAQGAQHLMNGTVTLDLFFGTPGAAGSAVESGIATVNEGRRLLGVGSGLLRGGTASLVGLAGFVGSYLGTSYLICAVNPSY